MGPPKIGITNNGAADNRSTNVAGDRVVTAVLIGNLICILVGVGSVVGVCASVQGGSAFGGVPESKHWLPPVPAILFLNFLCLGIHLPCVAK